MDSNFQFRLAAENAENDTKPQILNNEEAVRTASSTLTVGNLSYRVVSEAATTTISSSQNASASTNGLQTTAVLASPLNGQFYVIGNPSEVLGGSRTIAPRFSLDSGSSMTAVNSNPRHDRRRATHNEVERRRRDNINAWIMKLGRLIPPDQESGPPKSTILSKGGILSRACDYISELRETNREMSLRLSSGLGTETRDADSLRLQRQVEALKNENAMLRKEVENLNKQLDEVQGEGDDPLLN